MALLIPLQAVPNQTLTVPLAGQTVDLNIYQRTDAMFMDVFLNGAAIVLNAICENENRVVRDLYLGFPGDFAFYDSRGTTDPVYTGLGDRYQLIYIEAADLPAGVG